MLYNRNWYNTVNQLYSNKNFKKYKGKKNHYFNKFKCFKLKYFFIFCLFDFLNGCTCSIWKFRGQGSNRSWSCQPTPQPWKCRIQAIACGNARSLTHRMRPGMEPASLWVPVEFLTHWTTTRTPKVTILIETNKQTKKNHEGFLDLSISFFSLFYLFIYLLGLHLQYLEVLRLGVQSELYLLAYTTAHSNAGFLTHWARPGIEPTSSWMLVR